MQKIKKIINAVSRRLSALILFTLAYVLISLLIIFNPEEAMRKFVILGKASSKALRENKREKMFRDIDWDFWGPVLNTLAVVCVFICCIIFLANWTSKKSCYAGYAEYNPEYSFWGGCRIMHDGRMTPTEAIRGLE